MTDVSIIGLGQMGSVLAGLLLDAGKAVTVWNRSPEKAEGLVARGAALAASPAEAIGASPLTLVILYDDAAAQAILSAEAVVGALHGRTIANLGTTGPETARKLDADIAAAGGFYVDGAIQTAPSQMGQPDTPVLVSGPAHIIDQIEPVLKILGGTIIRVGNRIDATAFMDLATLSYIYGSFAGFLHGARIAETVGIDVTVYGKLVQAISPTFGAFFAHEASVIGSGEFTATESPLRISVSAVERIAATSRELGISDEVPELVHGWLKDAVSRGFIDEELAVLIKVLRSRGASAAIAA